MVALSRETWLCLTQPVSVRRKWDVEANLCTPPTRIASGNARCTIRKTDRSSPFNRNALYKKCNEFKNIIEVILFKENINEARAVFQDRGLWRSVDSAYPAEN